MGRLETGLVCLVGWKPDCGRLVDRTVGILMPPLQECGVVLYSFNALDESLTAAALLHACSEDSRPGPCDVSFDVVIFHTDRTR
eukprot:5341280-Amphidinium_carterae.1